MFSFGQISFLKKSQKTEKQKETKNIGPLKKKKKKKKKKNLPAGNSQRTTYSAIIGGRASVVAWKFVRLQHRYFIKPTNRFKAGSCSSLHI